VPLPPNPSAPAGTPPTSIARAFGEQASRWLSYPLGKGKPLDEVELTVQDFKQQIRTTKYYDAMNTNLHPFRRRGGKLMMYQGWADPLNPPSQMLEYYSEMRRDMGGQRRTDEFSRLFMINGMGHCNGGPTPSTSEMILQMVRWVEEGQAPESILATDEDPVTSETRQRPVFKYPLVPKYVGPDPAQDPSGPNRPENFVPAAPATFHNDDVRWYGDYLLRPAPPRKP
jgi:feruloyl esterase